jgi:hypothetical protein
MSIKNDKYSNVVELKHTAFPNWVPKLIFLQRQQGHKRICGTRVWSQNEEKQQVCFSNLDASARKQDQLKWSKYYDLHVKKKKYDDEKANAVMYQ